MRKAPWCRATAPTASRDYFVSSPHLRKTDRSGCYARRRLRRRSSAGSEARRRRSVELRAHAPRAAREFETRARYGLGRPASPDDRRRLGSACTAEWRPPLPGLLLRLRTLSSLGPRPRSRYPAGDPCRRAPYCAGQPTAGSIGRSNRSDGIEPRSRIPIQSSLLTTVSVRLRRGQTWLTWRRATVGAPGPVQRRAREPAHQPSTDKRYRRQVEPPSRLAPYSSASR